MIEEIGKSRDLYFYFRTTQSNGWNKETYMASQQRMSLYLVFHLQIIILTILWVKVWLGNKRILTEVINECTDTASMCHDLK